jgi:hypothetical protein
VKVKDIITIDKMRSKVLVDKGFAFPLYKKELKLFNIEIGKELYNYETDIEIHLKKRAISRLIYILSKSDKTEYELIRNLDASYYPKEVIKYAILYCRKHRYINDENYIREYIEIYRETRSKTRIKVDLIKKGLNKSDIDEILEEEYIDEEEQVNIFLKSININDVLGDKKELNKLINRLMRKGYKYDIIKSCIQNLL